MRDRTLTTSVLRASFREARLLPMSPLMRRPILPALLLLAALHVPAAPPVADAFRPGEVVVKRQGGPATVERARDGRDARAGDRAAAGGARRWSRRRATRSRG